MRLPAGVRSDHSGTSSPEGPAKRGERMMRSLIQCNVSLVGIRGLAVELGEGGEGKRREFYLGGGRRGLFWAVGGGGGGDVDGLESVILLVSIQLQLIPRRS